MSGRLFIVGTPIGNLGDITYRAVETLRRVTRVFAEDTRRTKALLSHLGIEGKRVIALHAHSTSSDLGAAAEMLESGEEVALVTDAGMPSVSDPGRLLVELARKLEISVEVVPGPSAVTSAVALSGLVDGPFTFLAFLPRKGERRRRMLSDIAKSAHPSLLFESPHRLNETLEDLRQVAGDARVVAICRELTKKFEETLVGPLAQLCEKHAAREWLGEITLVVSGGGTDAPAEAPDPSERARELLALGTSVKEATELLLGELKQSGQRVSKREIYQLLLRESADEGAPHADADAGDDDADTEADERAETAVRRGS